MPSRAPRGLIQIAARPETAFSRGGPPRLVVAPVRWGEARPDDLLHELPLRPATGEYAGSRIAVFLDDTVPADGYSASEVLRVR